MGGNMFAGVFGDDIFIRLTPADQTEVKKLGAKPFDPMKSGVMKNARATVSSI